MSNFIESLSLKVLDDELPQDSFTYLCPAMSTTSWLDHILCSGDLTEYISNVHIDYEGALYDNFPIYFNVTVDSNYNNIIEDKIIGGGIC